MTREELVRGVAEKAEIKKSEASKAVSAIFEIMKESLGKGEPVQMIGFGSFRVSQRTERKGRNPRTGEGITIPAAKVVKFTAGKALKEAVGSKKKEAPKQKKKNKRVIAWRRSQSHIPSPGTLAYPRIKEDR